MKKISLTLATLALLLTTGAPAVFATGDNPTEKTVAKTPTSLTVDPSRSEVNWKATKVGGEHVGTVKLANGTLQVNGNKLVGGSFAMDMTTIVDTDLTNASMNERLTNHLKSDDFFSVQKHPSSTFTITKAEPIAKAKAGEHNYTITGDLTIKGTTHPITFPATVKVAGNSAEATAKFDVNRIKYDIKYRSGLLGTAADKIIYDDFTIDLKLVAGPQKAVAGK
jgi:polyisoprenoid-binding protein YceI